MSKSPTLTVTLETVTPLFLGGADPRGEPELRAPSFRGAMRYWLRAAFGGVGYDVAAVREAEARVFGSTAEGMGTASAVVIQVPFACSLPVESFSEIVETQNRRPRRAGIAYLFFAARGTRREPERRAIKDSFQFPLRLKMCPRLGDETAFRQAYAALWLLTRFGGVGTRVRRGAGGVQAVRVVDGQEFIADLPHLEIQATTPTHLRDELARELKAIRALFGTSLSSVDRLPSFDILHPAVCSMWVVDRTYDDWKGALDKIGRLFQRFRSRRKPDYGNVKGAFEGGSMTGPIQRAAFGLPLPFYFRSLGGARGGLRGEVHDRRSSPLWIRVVKLANGKYALALLWFHSRFLSEGETLVLEMERLPDVGGIPSPSEQLLKTFLLESDSIKHSSLSDGGLNLMEVSYG